MIDQDFSRLALRAATQVDRICRGVPYEPEHLQVFAARLEEVVARGLLEIGLDGVDLRALAEATTHVTGVAVSTVSGLAAAIQSCAQALLRPVADKESAASLLAFTLAAYDASDDTPSRREFAA